MSPYQLLRLWWWEVCVCANFILTARDDLTDCSWKKTLPPSSGHTVLISLCDILSSSSPLSTPSVFTVLLTWTQSMSLITSACHGHLSNALKLSQQSGTSYRLEKPLYASHALTCGGLEDMLRVGGPRISWGLRVSWGKEDRTSCEYYFKPLLVNMTAYRWRLRQKIRDRATLYCFEGEQ